MKKFTITLDMEHIQAIANMFDIALRAQGIQIVKQIAPVLNILDEAVRGQPEFDHTDIGDEPEVLEEDDKA